MVCELAHRAFTRIGDEEVPDAKTLARLTQLIGPRVIEELRLRGVELAQQRGVMQGKRVRVETTAVAPSIIQRTVVGWGTDACTDAHPEEDQVGVGRIEKEGTGSDAQRREARCGDCLMARRLGPREEGWGNPQPRELLSWTRKVMNQAQRVLEESKQAPRRRRSPWEGRAESLEAMAGRVGQAVEPARLRIFPGDTTVAGRIVSEFRTAHGIDSQRESEQAH
jgi:IS5 family transposase